MTPAAANGALKPINALGFTGIKKGNKFHFSAAFVLAVISLFPLSSLK
jgi:hypothetical protein